MSRTYFIHRPGQLPAEGIAEADSLANAEYAARTLLEEGETGPRQARSKSAAPMTGSPCPAG